MIPDAELILGPPGCGKTTALLEIVDEALAAGIPPDRIGFVSFTKRAATEAISRARTRYHLSEKDLPYFRTLHSLCFKALGLGREEVFIGKHLYTFADLVKYRLSVNKDPSDPYSPGWGLGDRFMFLDSLARATDTPHETIFKQFREKADYWEFERFHRALSLYKKDKGLYDFNDMLHAFVESKLHIPFDLLLVDEAQDLSPAQWAVVRQLAQSAKRIVLAGDDDQAIYRWAGADVSTLISLPVIPRVLSQSWRVPTLIQTLAEAVVCRISSRREKHWNPRPAPGLVKRHATMRSIDYTGEDILVLGRNRSSLEPFEDDIRSRGFIYSYNGAASIKPGLIDAILGWEDVRKGNPISNARARLIYKHMTPGREFTKGQELLPQLADVDRITLQQLQQQGGLLADPNKPWFEVLSKIPMKESLYIRSALRHGDSIRKAPRIRLSTIHSIKGGEASKVILATDISPATRDGVNNSDDEHRVWYVGVTRAKEELHILLPQTSCYITLPKNPLLPTDDHL